MSDFKSFLKGNVKQAENVELKLDRFDEPLVLRPLSAGEADTINAACFKSKTGRKGKQETTFDFVKYNREVCAASIVFPDLSNKELQDSYETRGADNLYAIMFLVGEAAEILDKVREISGLNEDINDDVEEAKN